MANWHKPAEQLPEDNQACHLYIVRGMAADAIILDIIYKKDMGGWLDLFATEEAGSIYKSEHITAWIPVEELDFGMPD